MRNHRILLTGATGFVGSQLFPALQAQGYEVVCATRHPADEARAHPDREFRLLDTSDADTLSTALAGCGAVVYLIHGMAAGGDYAETERRGALAFRTAAEAAGVERIVYLGGMRPSGPPSVHLESRLRTGEILRSGSVSTIELQASMVIGSGSESFRMVRDLCARLPVMVLPAWSKTLTQPIGVADVTAAIVHALAEPAGVSGAFGLPGPEVLSAREILVRTSKLLGHNPPMFGVPFLSPKLSSYWIRLITRVDHHIADELVKGLLNDVVCRDSGYWARFPEHRLQGFDDAVQNALSGEQRSLSTSARVVEEVIDHLSPKEPHGPS